MPQKNESSITHLDELPEEGKHLMRQKFQSSITTLDDIPEIECN